MAISLPVRIGAIGCGAALEHLYVNPLRRLARRGWVQVVALADPSDRRREWARGVFPGARVEAEAARVLAETQPALTIITSPPPLHGAHAEIAFQAGCHVLCEKPLADSVAAGGRILDLARQRDRLLGVGMTRRFYPCLAEARRWLQAGQLGRVLAYEYREGGVYGWPVTSDAPFRRATSGGGVLLDKGIHVLDLLGWLFGPAEMIRSEDDAWRDGVEANSIVHLDHRGVAGRMQLSWDQDLNSGFLIRGERGDLMMPIGPLSQLCFRQPGQAWQPVPIQADWPGDLDAAGQVRGTPRTYYECIDFQLIQMLRALLLGTAVPVSGEEGLETLALVDAAYSRAEPLEQPWLPAVEQTLARQRHWHAQT
jgi:predicted dehydrogenase